MNRHQRGLGLLNLGCDVAELLLRCSRSGFALMIGRSDASRLMIGDRDGIRKSSDGGHFCNRLGYARCVVVVGDTEPLNHRDDPDDCDRSQLTSHALLFKA